MGKHRKPPPVCQGVSLSLCRGVARSTCYRVKWTALHLTSKWYGVFRYKGRDFRNTPQIFLPFSGWMTLVQVGGAAATAAGGYREESRRDDLLEMTLLQILIIPSLSWRPMPLGELNWESGRPLLTAQRNIRRAPPRCQITYSAVKCRGGSNTKKYVSGVA